MRRYYLDNLRWMTVSLVVIYHVIFMYNGVVTDGVIGSSQSVWFLDSIQYVLYPWFMVLLFMIAGMCSRFYLENHSEKDFFKSRTVKLLIPSTLGILTIGWAQGYISMRMSSAFENMPGMVPTPILYLIMILSGTGVLWFIQVLWINSLLLVLVRRFEKRILYRKTKNAGFLAFIICGVLYYIAAQILNTPIIAMYRFGLYGYVFFLGYFVLCHDEIIEKLCKYAWILLGVAVVFAGIYLSLHLGDNYAVMPVVGCLSASSYGYVMSLALLGLGKRYFDKTNSFFTFMNSRNFGIYVFHYLANSFVALCMEQYGNVPQALKYLIVLFASFLGSLVLYEVVRRIPVVRFLVLGLKKERN